MHRLIWGFAGGSYHIAGNFVSLLKSFQLLPALIKLLLVWLRWTGFPRAWKVLKYTWCSWGSWERSGSVIECSTDMSHCHKNVPDIVSVSHCWEHNNSCILISYVKACLNIVWRHMWKRMTLNFFFFTSCGHVYWCVCDISQLCLVRVNSLITHLQLNKMSVMYKSVHFPISYQLLEMSSITTPNLTVWNVCTRYIF